VGVFAFIADFQLFFFKKNYNAKRFRLRESSSYFLG